MRLLSTCLLVFLTSLAVAAEPDTGWVEPDLAPLVTRSGKAYGSACIWNDADSIRLRLNCDPGWTIIAAHLACGDALDDFLTQGGRILPPWKQPRTDLTYGFPGVTEMDLDIPILEGFAVGDEFLLSLQLILVQTAANGRIRGVRFIQLDGERLGRQRLRGYTIGQWWPTLELPAGPVSFKGWHPGPDSYWEHELLEVPEGDIAPGFYPAWCIQKDATMREGKVQTATLRNPYDPDLPEPFASQAWDQVNYLLNHRPTDLSRADTQDAIWILLGELTPEDVSAAAAAAAETAQTDGAGYIPGPEDDIGLIVDTPPDVQDTLMVETADPPASNG